MNDPIAKLDEVAADLVNAYRLLGHRALVVHAGADSLVHMVALGDGDNAASARMLYAGADTLANMAFDADRAGHA